MYICVTEVDSKTKIVCTEAPQTNGPSLPAVKGLKLDWADKSTWPVELAQGGTYLRAPKYYGTCDDDADTTIAGVLEILTEQEWMQRKYNEFYARQPYPSWIWDAETFVWSSPVPYPEGAEDWEYQWDEETVNWVSTEEVNADS